MSTHTPGPWRVAETFDRTGRLVAELTDGVMAHKLPTLRIVHDGPDEGDARADAALIAAAPELLRALCSVACLAGEGPDAYAVEGRTGLLGDIATEALAAIAKAEGRQ